MLPETLSSSAPKPLEPSANTAVAQAVLRGLGSQPRSLAPWLFYDQRGSELFERITGLAEYYLTRLERGIFAVHSEAILKAANPKASVNPAATVNPAAATNPERPRLTIVELGAGSASKTCLLLQAALKQQPSVAYCALDVSPSALAEATERIGQAMPSLAVTTRVVDYTQDLSALAAAPAAEPANHSQTHRKMVLWIGSSIGNFEPAEAQALLCNVCTHLRPGDSLLLGADFAPSPHKSVSTLLRAYQDADGVTAAFNRNVLVRINHELGANFCPEAFTHEARWSDKQARIEMHLVSRTRQQVEVPALGLRLSFSAGESIHTENSYKFTPECMQDILLQAGFTRVEQWTDPRHWFGVWLAKL